MQISLIIGSTVSVIVLVTGMLTAFAFRTHDTGRSDTTLRSRSIRVN